MKTTPTSIFSDYKGWMLNQGAKNTVANSYVSKLKSLLRELYHNGYLAMPNAENLLSSARNNQLFMTGLEAGIEDAINNAINDTPRLIDKKLINDGHSSFRRFVRFTQTLWSNSTASNATSTTSTLSTKTVSNKTASPANTVKTIVSIESVSQNKLISKLKSRIGTQGRVSGNKTWLSIRLVKHILGSEWFKKWSETIINSTKVYTDRLGSYKSISDIKGLELSPSVLAQNKNEVHVTDKDNNAYQVFTRKKNGNFGPMIVEDISEITLEHVKAIDKTLKELEPKIGELVKLSNLLKEADRKMKPDKKRTEYNLFASVRNNIKVTVNSVDLEQEMETIKNDTEYELMVGHENSSKGAK